MLMNINRTNSRHPQIINVIVTVLALIAAPMLRAGEPPKVGDTAPNFTLKSLEEQPLELHKLAAKSKVALVVLRGWPGYQCPLCDRQVNEFIQSASAFAEAGIQIVFVYPGPAGDLKAHAEEFKRMKGRQWPKEFLFVLDPDFSMVNAYGLRWAAPNETAYPSTFILDTRAVVRFAKISHGHGDRSKASDVLAEAKMVSNK